LLKLKNQEQIGIAHDGDADRCLLIDHNGQVIDGDFILMILASALMAENKLNKKTVVGTVMSNLGFVNAMEEQGIAVVKTAVGDRYVLENMLVNNYSLGGEQSGHVILREFSNTGDGLLTALQVMQVLAKSKKSLSELAAKMQKYPQVLINVKDVKKEKLAASTKINDFISEQEKVLGNTGRILVRASGTESLIRVMVEAQEMQSAQKIADSLAELVRSELK
jgi:phosphoglucosamine mutase